MQISRYEKWILDKDEEFLKKELYVLDLTKKYELEFISEIDKKRQMVKDRIYQIMNKENE
jgi:hypothetical protein